MTETKVFYIVNFIACVCLIAFWIFVVFLDDNPSKIASLVVGLITGWYLCKISMRIKYTHKGGRRL